MQKKSIITISSLLCLMLSGCTFSVAINADKDYEDKEIYVIREMKVEEGEEKASPVRNKTMTLRFYDEAPNVPYVKVSSYFKEFFNTNFNVKKSGDNYRYGYNNEHYISFNANEDLFSSLGLRAFNSHPDFKSSTGKSFIKSSGSTKTPSSVKVISLSNYSIDIRDDGKEAYVPLSLLSKLAGGFASYNAQYNGKDVYVIDNQGLLTDIVRDVKYYSDSYYEILGDLSTARPSDLAVYTYNELCFVFDNLRGYTTQLLFGDNNLLSLGLNGILEKYYPSIKEYLLSTDKNKYFQGLFTVFAGLSDGGHTGCICQESNYMQAMAEATSNPDFKGLINGYISNSIQYQYSKLNFQAGKKESFGIEDISTNPNYYYFDDISKTAYIGFDSFINDYDGWDNYYNGKGEVPVNTDSYAFIRSKFYQAKEDGVENLVIDLTTNGGGNSGALLGIVGLLNGGKAYFETNDTFNKYRSTERSLIDINLDGEFNEEDAQELEQFDFNIGILTSKCAFSCGNLLPSVLKELGYKIIGEKSGGGSCAVIMESTADGIPYAHSSYLCLSDASGNNIDSGVPVDFSIDRIPSPTDPSTFDASNFYDIATIGEYLRTAYQNNE